MGPIIYVLAGVNGCGKSSIGETIFRAEESVVFNPDTVAAEICNLHPDIPLAMANAHAWQIGRELLDHTVAGGHDYRFETTLGGRTIPRLLEDAVRAGHRLHVWFCGLESPELHLRRVRTRASRGGHDIPEKKIRERWTTSRENLIRLLPLIAHLRVYDNSYEANPGKGKHPRPVLWLEMRDGKITAPADLSGAPGWVQPIIAAAVMLQEFPVA